MHARLRKPPTATVSDLAMVALRALSPVRSRKTPPTLRVLADGKHQAASTTVPREAFELFVEVLEQLAKGNSVTIVPRHSELTTQEAAELLNVSRPFVITLLNEGKIPFRLVGSHRRIRMADLIAFKAKDDAHRATVLDELVEEAEKHGLGY